METMDEDPRGSLVVAFLAALTLLGCLLFGLWLFLSAASAVFGETRINVVHAIGPNSLNRMEAMELYEKAKEQFEEEVGEKLNLVSFTSRRDPFRRLRTHLSNSQNLLYSWELYFLKHPKKARNIAIIPPLKEQDTYYLFGWTGAICSRRGTSITVAEKYNSKGEGRFPHSIVSFLHELGHLCGARHDNLEPITIMNANALPYTDLGLHYSPLSLSEITRCLR